MEEVREEGFGWGRSEQSDTDHSSGSLSLDEIGEVLAEMRF